MFHPRDFRRGFDPLCQKADFSLELRHVDETGDIDGKSEETLAPSRGLIGTASGPRQSTRDRRRFPNHFMFDKRRLAPRSVPPLTSSQYSSLQIGPLLRGRRLQKRLEMA